MSYASNDELPDSVQSHLPEHAKSIFREAYNDAVARRSGESAAAVRSAWAAVEHGYEKIGGKWRLRLKPV